MTALPPSPQAPALAHTSLASRAQVPFVSVGNMARLVRARGLGLVLRELAGKIEADFRRWESFEKTTRVACHARHGDLELMPTSDGVAYGVKYVSGHPRNARAGLQTVTGLGLLAEVETGYPVLLAEMTLLTALRTAATSAMVTKLLAPAGAHVLALIGNGAQSEFQATALQGICGVDTVRLYDIDPAATAKARHNLAAGGLTVIACASAREAVEGAQIITTCTADKRCATILTDDMIHPGVHINAIGGDSPGKTELDPAILLRTQTFVEYPPQTRVEGEIQQMPATYPVTELWRVLTGTQPGRRNAQDITLFDGVGFAIEDFSALCYLRQAVEGSTFCQMLDAIAAPADPRNLFGLLRDAA